ncbi:MAG: ribonuclease H-like domain-containing protein [Lachnospiraceae bacterium]|nr:ribonuclease H-like domain-containing protein [Lachnospiraceae bacterium]
MKTFNKTITEYDDYIFPNQMLILDIETSSFSPNEGFITEAGIIIKSSSNLILTQFVLEELCDEEKVLRELLNIIKESKLIVTMDGNTFQLSFLNGRFSKYYSLYSDYQTAISKCIFLSMKQYLKILSENQPFSYDVHSFALKNGYKRKSTTQSLDLISIFAAYIGNNKLENLKKSNTQSISSVYLNKMLLHNEDDLLELFTTVYTLNLNPIKLEANDILSGTLAGKIEKRELKYYLDNPKDYVYLISEDMAIHKSLAFSSNKDNITKCTKQNCYIRKTGCFFPIEYPKFLMSLYSSEESKKIKLFSENLSSKIPYAAVSENEKNEFIADKYLSTYLHFLYDYSIIN